jgi:hypothetical protein
LGKKWGGFIMLDPANPPEEEQSINSELRPGYTLIHGYATDDDGRPVNGVSVRLLGAAAETATNQRGYFELSVPTPPLDTDTDTLVAEKAGYKTAVHKNFIVEGEDGGTGTLDLERGTGKTEFDDTPAIRKSAETSEEQTPYVPEEQRPNQPSKSCVSGSAAQPQHCL